MPFKSLVTLVNTMRGWFYPRQVGKTGHPNRSDGLVSTFRRLEKRRVFAVDAFFVGGALDIEVTSVGETNANLLADGTDFFVDKNNNLTFELGEVRGAIADLRSVNAFSMESIGKLFWKGDFSLAPLNMPLGTGEVVRSGGLSEVHLQADFNAAGNVGINAINTIDFDANIMIQGNLAATVSPMGSIVDDANADIHVLGDAVLLSHNTIRLADDATASWVVDGLTKVDSLTNIELGLVGSWDSVSLSATANDISVIELNAISIQSIHTLGDFELTASGSLNDTTNSSLIVDGMANLQGSSINLTNDAGDVLTIGSEASLTATLGSVSIGEPGTVTLGDVSASGTSVTLFEDADTILMSIQTTGNFSANSTGTITDLAGANIQAATMNLNAVGLISLADNATDVLKISGAVSLVSTTSSVTISSPGTVTLGDVTASGTNVTLFEDADTNLASIQTPGNFSATSTATITDVAGATILAATMNLNAVGSILLADNAPGVLNISGAVSLLSTTSSVTIASPGTVTLGDVTASGTNVTLFEDADTTLATIHTTGNFSATSTATITDVAGASIQAATLNLNAVGLMSLADNATDILNISGVVSLLSTTGSVTIASPGSVTLGDVTASGTSVTLFEDADTTLASIQTPGNFSATSTATITDVAGASIQAGTLNLNAFGLISLADIATDVLNISGVVSLLSNTGSVTIASTGTVTLGDVSASGTNVTLFEDADTTLQSIQTPGNFSATSTGTITNVAGASIQAATLNLNASGLILLADNATDILNITGAVSLLSTTSSVTIASPGTVTLGDVTASGTNITLFEDADTTLASIQTPGNFSATCTGMITDVVGAAIQAATLNLNAVGLILLADNATDVLNVSGSVSLISTTGSVTIASPGTVMLGHFTASGTNVTLFEDANTTLAAIQTPGNFSTTSTGSITDVLGAIIQADAMDLKATAIHLADDSTDVISVTFRSFIVSTTSIDIDSNGSVNFGSIGFLGNSVVVFEDSSAQLDGSNVGQLELHARDSVTQSGIDTGAGTTVLRVAGTAHLSLLASPGSVDLYRASSNPPSLFSDGRLLDNKIDGVFNADGIDGDFRFRNNSTQAVIGTILGTFDDLTIWHTQASILLPNQVFQIAGNLELIAGMDEQDPGPRSSNPIDQMPNGGQGIADSGTRLNVSGDVHLLAAGNILIGDAIGESFQATMGSTSLVSLGGGQVALGGAGVTTLAELGIYSQSLVNGQRGNTVVQLDQSVTLINPSMPIPDGSLLQFTANSISIQTTGDLSNNSNTQINAAGNLDIVAASDIDLINNTGDSLRVLGTSDLRSRTGAIELGLNGTVELQDVNLNAPGGKVSVGGPGRTELGTIEVRAIDISVREETAMTIRAAIAANELILVSDQSILNTVAFVPNGSFGISARELVIDAGTYAHLGRISTDRFTGAVHANGMLSSDTLFALNPIADLSGQSYLNAVGENLPSGIAPLNPVLSGETISELSSKASFIQTFGIEYGLFVQNNKGLTLQAINATGDAIRLMVETDRGADLIVAGTVHQRFTNADPGGVVLIAGNHLIFNQGAELRIEHVSPDVATTRVVLQPNLVASAFDGGGGPAGYQSTRDVLYASDAFADTGTQNVLQKVSTRFGVAGEAGFQTLIRYADGSSQLFDANEELDASLQSNPAANTRQGVVSAHASTAGDAAVVERKFAFSDSFLGTFQTLPTSALFRRSAEFFLFEQSGVVDVSVTHVDLTPVVDLVGEVFSPGRKVSLSLPTEILVTPSILVAPVRIAPDAATTYTIVSSDAEPSVLSDARFEVFIVNVGFNDSNRDGQPSDSELPSRNEVRVDSIVSKEEAAEETKNQSAQPATKRLSLLPGEPNSSSQEFKSNAVPTAEDIEAWITEYKNDPTKPSGAYAIISDDSVTGVKVLKVFGVRDFEATQPNPTAESDSITDPDGQPETDPPKVPIEPKKSTSAFQQNAIPGVEPIESAGNGQLGMFAAGVAVGAVWTVSNGNGNRFGRLARSLRALHRNLSGSQNDQVS